MLETAIISAMLPGTVEVLKNFASGISRKWAGLSVDDEIKLSNANVTRLKALAELDNPHGTPSQWVVDLRGSFRYIACGIFVVGGLSMPFLIPSFANLGLEAAVAASSFIFGERMVLSLKK